MRKKRVTLTAEQQQQALNLVLSGTPVLEVAYQFNASVSKIQQIVRDGAPVAPKEEVQASSTETQDLLAYLAKNGITNTTSFIEVTNNLAKRKARKIFSDLSAEEKVSWLTPMGNVKESIFIDPSLSEFHTPQLQEVAPNEHGTNPTATISPI